MSAATYRARKETAGADGAKGETARVADRQRKRVINQQVDSCCSQRLVITCEWGAECNCPTLSKASREASLHSRPCIHYLPLHHTPEGLRVNYAHKVCYYSILYNGI